MASWLDRPGAADPDEDMRLIERFLTGDAEAFDRLYAKYYDRVYALAIGVLLRPEEAADATQEIFTLAYRNLHRFCQRSRFSTWLFRIAINRSIQHARTLKHQRLWVPLEDVHEKPAESPPAQDPRISAALQRLAPDDRAALVLFYWEDLSVHDLAESLGCSINAAKTRLFRARERFRRVYEGMESV